MRRHIWWKIGVAAVKMWMAVCLCLYASKRNCHRCYGNCKYTRDNLGNDNKPIHAHLVSESSITGILSLSHSFSALLNWDRVFGKHRYRSNNKSKHIVAVKRKCQCGSTQTPKEKRYRNEYLSKEQIEIQKKKHIDSAQGQ